MSFKQGIVLIFVTLFFNCNQGVEVTKIEGKRIEINDTITSDTTINAYIKPFQVRVKSELDSVLAYSKNTYSKKDGAFNTAIGNFMADLVRKRGNSVYKQRTGKTIDLAMLNHGGIRSIISEGDVTIGDAYKVMPFENSIVVIELSGKTILEEMIPYLIKAKRAHPISGLKLHINDDDEVVLAQINKEKIDPERNYNVATNDYLYFGGDGMLFFQKGSDMMALDYKIRNAIIDHLSEIDTIAPKRDDRFILK